MSTDTTRRLDAERLTRTTMETRVAQWRRREIPCTCHACQLAKLIHDEIAAGRVVHMHNVAGGVVPPAHDAEGTKH